MKKHNQKQDSGKLRYDLIPFDSLDKVAEVLTIGANKYEPGNWLRDSSEADICRYEAALLRHMSQHMQGNYLDEETWQPHMAHIVCNALFIMSLKEKFKDGTS